MQEIIQNEPLLLFGIVVISGFYMGSIVKRFRLPSLIGFMILGVLLGPSVLNLFTNEKLINLSFITQIVLGFVAFSIGSELSIRSLRQLGSGIISIILAESFMAFLLVMLAVYALTQSWILALLFGSLAPASAPAGTVAVIQEYRAKGNLTKALYAVVGFDDGLAILIFGFAAALAKNLLMVKLNVGFVSEGFLASMKQPALEIIGSLVLGTVLGFIFCQLVRRLHASRNILIMTFGFILFATGLSNILHLSGILTNMTVGFILVNTRREAFVHRVIAPSFELMPLFFLMFFCLAGAHLNISILRHIGFIGAIYIFARSLGKITGARLGAMIGKTEQKIKKYIGLGILSQAGVAIGLALIIRHEFEHLAMNPEVANAVCLYAEQHPNTARILFDPLAISTSLITVVTATCIVFEIIGPILTKYALEKAGEIPKDKVL